MIGLCGGFCGEEVFLAYLKGILKTLEEAILKKE